MATYKVAQDVEADDKLLGPFSARQFIYLVIVAMAGMIAWFLSQLFMPLVIIPLPIMLFFGALALPLRKDQPMEVYLAAMVSYYLKPRRRFWVPDGIESLIEITAPKVDEVKRTKEFGQDEAQQRLSYLADIVDTEGWAVRRVDGAIAAPTNTSMMSDVYFDAQATVDPLDDSGSVAQGFESMIAEADERRRHDIMERMRNPATFIPPDPYATFTPTMPTTAINTAPTEPTQPSYTDDTSDIKFNPYPNIHQSVLQPLSTDDQVQTTEPTNEPQPQPANEPDKSTSETSVSPDIINLVSNSNLSIETMAREAHRIHKKDEEDEVLISLR